jgi:uncharacterized Tic20 family protein
MTDETRATDEFGSQGVSEAHDPFASVDVNLRPPAPEERTWATVAHIAGIASSLVFPIIVSLVIYSVKKDESEFVADQAREALNFQITTALAAILAALSIFCLIGFFLVPLVALASLVFSLIGAIRAYDGKRYRYPVCLRLL